MSPSELTNRPVLIVDVDETLFDTIPRKIAIIRDLFNMEVTYDEARADYNLSNYLCDDDQLNAFFIQFHSGKYLHLDTAIDHASQVLKRLAEKVDIIYLTGRHANGSESWMDQKSVTLQSLQQYGFPYPDGQQTVLEMKPKFEGFESIAKQADDDRKFKMKVVSELVGHQDVLAGIGDSYTDLFVYGEYNVPPICLKRSHLSLFKKRLNKLPIQPFIAADWLEIEKQILDLFKNKDYS